MRWSSTDKFLCRCRCLVKWLRWVQGSTRCFGICHLTPLRLLLGCASLHRLGYQAEAVTLKLIALLLPCFLSMSSPSIPLNNDKILSYILRLRYRNVRLQAKLLLMTGISPILLALLIAFPTSLWLLLVNSVFFRPRIFPISVTYWLKSKGFLYESSCNEGWPGCSPSLYNGSTCLATATDGPNVGYFFGFLCSWSCSSMFKNDGE